MRRRIELEATDFLRRSLEHEARRYGLSVSTLLGRAAQYYLLERESDRLAARFPRLARELPAESQNRLLPVAIELRAAEWRELDSAAASERLPVERLFEHAALLFVADLESGHVAARLLESAEAEAD